MRNCIFRHRRGLLKFVVLWFLSFPLTGETQTFRGTVALFSAQFEVDRLAPGLTTGERTFCVDDADNSISLEIFPMWVTSLLE